MKTNKNKLTKMTKLYPCLLVDRNLIIAPHDKGESPNWVPRLRNEKVVWVDREIFELLKKEINNKPCLICPQEIKKNCENEKYIKKLKEK